MHISFDDPDFNNRFQHYAPALQKAFWQVVEAGHAQRLDWYFERGAHEFAVRAGIRRPGTQHAQQCLMVLDFQRASIKFHINQTYRSSEIAKSLEQFHETTLSDENASAISKAIRTAHWEKGHACYPNSYPA